jgi:outer membrane protein OmpA-like peptidoglycan-associated protein
MTFRSFVLGCAAVAVLAAPAAAGPKGWYIGISGGANWVAHSDWLGGPIGGVMTSTGAEVNSDTGYAVLGTVGYRFMNNWRAEVEAGYRFNDTSIDFFIPLPPPSIPSEITEYSAMMNVLYDIPLSDRFRVSLGAGIGLDFFEFQNNVTTLSSDETLLAAQFIAQAGYDVTKRLELYVDYHFLVADEPELIFGAAQRTMEVDKHAALIGLRYDLQPDAEPAPPPAPMAPPPPPPVKQFIVFFGFNKYNLTADAQAVVSEAASAAKSQGAASILVVGHTDTVGGNKYNQKLSEKRANAVKDELVRLGVAPGMISASGKGETELMVSTGDGVKEPQNRRATIDLK